MQKSTCCGLVTAHLAPLESRVVLTHQESLAIGSQGSWYCLCKRDDRSLWQVWQTCGITVSQHLRSIAFAIPGPVCEIATVLTIIWRQLAQGHPSSVLCAPCSSSHAFLVARKEEAWKRRMLL